VSCKILFPLLLSIGMLCMHCSIKENSHHELLLKIQNDNDMEKVLQMAEKLVISGFTAGDSYGEVWIRDLNTFIKLSCKVSDPNIVREQLLMFFKFQGEDGNIIDGFIPKNKAGVSYKYIYSNLANGFAGHKNTVETDQESSLIQATWKYIRITGDKDILQTSIAGITVLERMDMAMQFLLNDRFSDDYGLIWGATTADWGDVQPEHPWGVEIDENTHYAIDIYDNAMFIIAISNFLDFVQNDHGKTSKWEKVHTQIKKNVRSHLWDNEAKKFIPHIYLEDSPFPMDYDENQIHYHGGTAVAIEAGLLSKDEIIVVNKQMIENVIQSGAPSIGLTVYPPYPEGFFQNKAMYPYGYQNGGDWTWFGGRMIQQLIQNGLVYEAYEEIQPMIHRVIENNGFYEWYKRDGTAAGSGHFRGSAGVLAKAIEMFNDWAAGQE